VILRTSAPAGAGAAAVAGVPADVVAVVACGFRVLNPPDAFGTAVAGAVWGRGAEATPGSPATGADPPDAPHAARSGTARRTAAWRRMLELNIRTGLLGSSRFGRDAEAAYTSRADSNLGRRVLTEPKEKVSGR
jgi:hypothetical protein